nr:transposase zinc-binding domain-containing protein [Candidatus Chloroploca mongolica]
MARPQLANHHHDLYPPHPHGRAAGRRRPGGVHGWPVVITLGDVFRRDGPAYRARWGSQRSPPQLAAMHAIEACRTEARGGQLYRCPHCDQVRSASHSCRNRHGPTCQQDAAQDWLARQHDLLLPVPSFLVTFTLPGALRAIAFQHQAQVDDLFFRALSRPVYF